MRHCPSCRRAYADAIKFCPEDGTGLPLPADPLLGAKLMGQFQVAELCGVGSMGTVYRAWQTTMERNVAIKVLRRELSDNSRVRKRFFREARAVARLSHPNIVSVYVVGELPDGRPFLVMEYVEGASLERVCRLEAPLPPVRAIHIGRQIVDGLAEAHANEIIHRDLKPANILLSDRRTASDVVTLVDFGIAKILSDDEQSKLTQAGAIFGTPFYISPEQAVGEPLDARCDLYALGVILYRVLTGELPFEAQDGMEVLIKHLKQAPRPPREIVPSIPPQLERVVMRALRKDRATRWQTAAAFGSALSEAYESIRGAGTRGRSAAPPAAAVSPVTAASPATTNLALAPISAHGHRAPLGPASPAGPDAADRALAAVEGASTGLLRQEFVPGAARARRAYTFTLALALGAAAGAAYPRISAKLGQKSGGNEVTAPTQRPVPPSVPDVVRPQRQAADAERRRRSRPPGPAESAKPASPGRAASSRSSRKNRGRVPRSRARATRTPSPDAARPTAPTSLRPVAPVTEPPPPAFSGGAAAADTDPDSTRHSPVVPVDDHTPESDPPPPTVVGAADAGSGPDASLYELLE